MEDLEEQIDALSFDLENKVEYYRSEFNIPYHAVIGVLESIKHNLLNIDIDFVEDNES